MERTNERRLLHVCAGLVVWAVASVLVAAGCASNGPSFTPNDAGVDDTSTGDATMCAANQKSCAGACVDTSSDVSNCGACGIKCGAGQLCSKGACATTCVGGTTLCNGGCSDTKSDPDNCGACGTRCAAGEVCSNSACALFCAGGSTKCGQSCVNIQLDPSNCGGCTKQCGAGQLCGNGVCGSSCGTFATCGGAEAGADAGALYCANTSTDNQNCGRCGNVCPAGTACSNGACSTTCGAGERICTPDAGAAYCANTSNDRGNCGSCGNQCAAGQVCVNGACAVSCPGTEIVCNGVCVDPQTSNQHCGASAGCGVADAGGAGVACAAGSVCVTGSCTTVCPGTQIVCNGQCVDPSTSNQYCGATAGCGAGGVGTAGTACLAGQVCNARVCSVSCPGTQINCGGVCVDPATSNQHCGASGDCIANAGTNCPAGQVCNASVCSTSCPGTEVNCGGVCIAPGTDPVHCGATAGCGAGGVGSGGTSCGAGMMCSGGNCVPSCQAPLIPCGGVCVDPQNDPQHCGGCNACPGAPNVTATACSNSACVVRTCSAGFVDCNSTYADGCETNTTQDRNNCGFCGHTCPASAPGCSGGVCGTCATVAGIRWCYDPTPANCGQSCNTLCANLGLPLTISDAAWLAAQNTAPLCQPIAAAFGNTSTVNVGSYSYACMEFNAPSPVGAAQMFCSNFNGCPAQHRTASDACPFRGLCPCQ